MSTTSINAAKDAVLQSPFKTTFILASAVSTLWLTKIFLKWLKLRRHFEKLKLKAPKPLPYFGNLLGFFGKGPAKHDEMVLNTYGSIAGYFEGSRPIILTKDPKLVKVITIKEFGIFSNRRTFDGLFEEPFDKFLINLKDDEWKNVRSLLTSTFTSGKLKLMSKCVLQCADNFLENLEDLVQKDGILETKKAFGSYTLDVISSCCFGIEINAVKDPDNIFLKHLQQVFSNTRSPRIFLVFIFPTICKFLIKLGLFEIFPRAPFVFLKNVTTQIINKRRSKEEYREDFIQHMVEHEETGNDGVKEAPKDEDKMKTWSNTYLKKSLNNNEILAQAIMFLTVGYETTATTLVFASYNLAMYPECQRALQEEVDRVLEDNNGEINYDTIAKMTYLEAVLNETLRIYPPAPRIERICSMDYEYNDPETGMSLKIPKGQIVTASIWSIHHDPENYPEPEKFIPDRFLNRANKIENEKYLPFSSGPRNCIAMRFALMEAKLLLAKIVSKFEFRPTDSTPSLGNLVLDKTGLIRPLNPLYLKIQKRGED